MKKFLALTIIISILISVFPAAGYATGNSVEGLYKDGMEYYEKRDYDSAIARFRVAGEARGYAPAQNMLGVCYRDGLGTEKDLEEAERYFKLSADQGYEPAQDNLASLEAERDASANEKSDAYQDAMNLYFNGDYEAAKAAFEVLGDYERSLDFILMCENAIQEKDQKRKDEYESAVKLYNSGEYVLAKEAFEALGDYLDSKDYLAKCDKAIKALQIKPVITSLEIDEDGKLTVKWDEIPEAEHYTLIRRRVNEGKDYTRVYDTKSTSHTMKVSENAGETFYFKVAAVFPDGTVSDYSDEKGITVPIKKTVLLEPVQTAVAETAADPVTFVVDWADTVKTGDTVEFGSFEQDNNASNSKEPIKWQVLDIQGDKALLISKDALESKQYNDVHAYVYWQASTLRRWLNTDFYQDAFSEMEKLAVLSTEVRTEALSKNNSIAGDNTQDYVFILSTAEAEQYFSSTDARKCIMTTNAQLHAGTDQAKWWLRTSGTMNDDACFVDTVGGIHYSGDKVNRTGMCIRPAIWVSLKEITTQISEPKNDVSEEMDKIQKAIWSSSIGDSVIFGAYEQDNNSVNGKEPIEWMVLDIKDDRALLVSKKALDSKSVNPTDNVSWEECMLRAWLNSAFYESAFSEEEKDQVLWTKVTMDKNPKNSMNLGNDTTDKVFLLSIKEAEELFLNDEQRMCEPTAYAKTNGAHISSNGKVYWWLRTLMQSRNGYVDSEGEIEYRGEMIKRADFAVRPAIWIKLDPDAEMPAVETGLTEETAHALKSVSVGSMIPFGTLDQDNNSSNGQEQIEWQVLDIRDDKALVISKDALAVLPFNSEITETTWENSTLRTWLNSVFLNYAFSPIQQQMILKETVKADKNPQAYTDQGHSTYDKVFLLSVEEAEKYFSSAGERTCYPSENAKKQGAYVSQNGCAWWWLRSSGVSRLYAAVVQGEGVISSGDQVVSKTVIAVRPAMWISLTS